MKLITRIYMPESISSQLPICEGSDLPIHGTTLIIGSNHGLEMFNVFLRPVVDIDRGPQKKKKKTLNTENPWLNVIIIHSKFISSSFKCLFSTTISPPFTPIYRDDIVESTVEINACDTCHSVDKPVRVQVEIYRLKCRVLCYFTP